MMRKARLAIRKVNVTLDRPSYYFGTGRSRIRPLKKINQESRTYRALQAFNDRTFSLPEEYPVNENA
jgi:hypothetical protein